MKKVLLFGASGFAGSYLAREFASCGYQVHGSDRSWSKRIGCVSTQSIVDITDFNAVRGIVDEVAPECIVNLAAVSSVGQSWGSPQATIQVNVVGALNILEAVRLSAAKCKILLVGSSEEYAPSDAALSEDSPLRAGSPYGISKAAQERFAELYSEHCSMSVYRVRAFNHTGVGQSETFVLPNFCKQVARFEQAGHGGVMEVGNIDVVRDFSDVRDVARAYRMIVESSYDGEVFNIGSGIPRKLSDLLKIIKSFGTQDIEVRVDPGRCRAGEPSTIYADISKAESLLGWRPEYTLEMTLKEMFDSYC